MSVTWKSTWFIGFEARFERKTSTVTRYNETTGEPYQKEIEEDAYRFMVGDKVVLDSYQFDGTEEVCEGTDEERFLGLFLVRDQQKNWYWGVCLAVVDDRDGRWMSSNSLAKAHAAATECKEKALAFGIFTEPQSLLLLTAD